MDRRSSGEAVRTGESADSSSGAELTLIVGVGWWGGGAVCTGGAGVGVGVGAMRGCRGECGGEASGVRWRGSTAERRRRGGGAPRSPPSSVLCCGRRRVLSAVATAALTSEEELPESAVESCRRLDTCELSRDELSHGSTSAVSSSRGSLNIYY